MLGVERVNVPGNSFGSRNLGMRPEERSVCWFWVGLLVGPGDKGLLLGLTVLFPVLLRLPPVGYEPKLGFLRNW